MSFRLTEKKSNILDSFIFDNPSFFYGGENRRLFDETFFGEQNFQENRYKLGNLKMSDLLNANNTVIDIETLNRILGFRIQDEKYNILRRCLNELSGQSHGH